MENISGKSEIKKRLYKFLFSVVIVFGLGLAYYFIVRFFKIAIPCPIHALTGKYCPGCGISRMCIALLQFDFHTAYLSNRFLFVMSPVFIIYFLVKEIIYIIHGTKKTGKLENCILILVLVATIAFGIIRNIDAFSYLQPMG